MTQTTQPGRPEPEWLPRRDDLAALLAAGGFPEGPGAWAVLEPPGPGSAGDVALVALRDVVWHPATGLVTQGGLPVFSPSNQIPDLGRALRRAGRGPVAALERAALWVSPGGLRNYGHFLFDGLTGLAALEEPRVTGRFRAVSGPLNGWQRELLAASGLRSEEITAETVEIGQVVYTTCMNSYLNRASALVPALAERFGRGGAAARGAVYLSRRGYTGRIMVNEAALEAALAAEGVRVLRPETMPVAAQIAAARGARVLIGASGAGAVERAVPAAGRHTGGTAPRAGERAVDGADHGGAGAAAPGADPAQAGGGRGAAGRAAAATAAGADGAVSLLPAGGYPGGAGRPWRGVIAFPRARA